MDTEMTAGESIAPDAGESTKGRGAPGYDGELSVQEHSSSNSRHIEPTHTAKKSFDELIEGEYRREYGEKVEAVVKGRLKSYAETRQKLEDITEMISELGSRLGIDSDDPRQIIAAVTREKEDTDSKAEGASPIENKEGEQISEFHPDTVQRVKELAERVREAKEFYPELDIAKELVDPEFAMLLRICSLDPKRAYEMKYHDRIITNAMHYAVTQTEKKLADNMARRTNRPSENAVSGNSAVILTSDPKSLTKKQRSDIKKRVRKGEKIFWD